MLSKVLLRKLAETALRLGAHAAAPLPQLWQAASRRRISPLLIIWARASWAPYPIVHTTMRRIIFIAISGLTIAASSGAGFWYGEILGLKTTAPPPPTTAHLSISPTTAQSPSPVWNSSPVAPVDDACNQPLTTANTLTTYVNSDYGFTLTFDNIWKGYKVVAMPSYQSTDLTLLQFEIPTAMSPEGGNIYGVVFTMAIYPVSDWRRMLPLGGPADYTSVPTFVGSNSRYLFGYSLEQDGGFVQDYICEVQRVMQSFEPLSDGT